MRKWLVKCKLDERKKWLVRTCRHLLLGEKSYVKCMHTRNR